MEAGAVAYSINAVILRQAIIPDRLQGRVNATIRVISYGAIPLGALLGGLLANWYSLRLAVLIAGLGTLLAFLWIFFSPVKTLHELP